MIYRLTIVFISAIVLAHGAVLSIGPGDSIQSAIYAAHSGDIIEVGRGTYYDHLKVDKPITLRGIGMPVLDATASGSGVTITADGVQLEGFRIINSGSMLGGMPASMREEPEAGIKVLSKNNIIRDNNVSNNFNGVYLSHSDNNTIFNNMVKDNLGFGIRLEGCKNNTIYANSFVDNYRQNVCDDGSDHWDNGSIGNYYSDFRCNNRNGEICISGYAVPGGKNIDRYPTFRILR
ncbi:MAG: nitrous oxide reductase family maturation protein NosD [Methanotrichaceae archaeon]